MRLQRRAGFALGGGFVLAGALASPAFAEPVAGAPLVPMTSLACTDRAAAVLSVADGGLGITSISPMPAPPFLPAPMPPPANPAVAVLTVHNPGDSPFTALVVRDAEDPVPVLAAGGASATAAFEVADGAASTFRITDAAGVELALVTSTSDCTPPAGWCDEPRTPGAPVAADFADLCEVEGDGVLTVPSEAAESAEPAPSEQVAAEAPSVLDVQLAQTAPPPPPAAPLPYGVIGVPSPEPAAPAPEPVPQIVAAPPPPAPELAATGSGTNALAGLAALLLGSGYAVVGLGERRVDAELDTRMGAAMARISAAAAPDAG